MPNLPSGVWLKFDFLHVLEKSWEILGMYCKDFIGFCVWIDHRFFINLHGAQPFCMSMFTKSHSFSYAIWRHVNPKLSSLLLASLSFTDLVYFQLLLVWKFFYGCLTTTGRTNVLERFRVFLAVSERLRDPLL